MADILTFRIELVLDFDQRKTWERLVAEARSLHKTFRRELERQHGALGFVVARNFFVEREETPESFLGEQAVRHIAGFAHDRFDPGKSGRATSRAPVLLPAGDVVFSISEDSVRLPHLGVARYRKNKRFSTRTAMTENQQWLSSNVESMTLQEIEQKRVLLIDCRDEQTKQERQERRKERLSKRNRSRASATARRWLGSEDEPE